MAGSGRTTSTLSAEGTHRAAFAPLDYGCMLGSSGIWGASFVLIATSLDHFAPGVVTFVRITVGAVVLGLFPGARTPVERSDRWRVLWLSILWLAFPMTLYPVAQQYISSGLTGMLGASIPVFTALVAALALGHLPSMIHRVGIAVGGAGIVLLGLPALGDGGSSVFGVALIVVACVAYGLVFNVAVPLVQRYGAMPVFWRALVISIPMTAPYAWFGLARSSFGWSSLIANVTLGAGGTAIAFALLLTLTARVGATRSSMVTYLEAAFAFVLGTIIRHEPVRPLEVLGCAVLLVGAWLATRAEGGVLAAPSASSS